MANLLHQNPMLLGLYQLANEQGALGTKSAEFWVTYLRHAFSDLQRYHVSQKIPHDGSLLRVGVVAK